MSQTVTSTWPEYGQGYGKKHQGLNGNKGGANQGGINVKRSMNFLALTLMTALVITFVSTLRVQAAEKVNINMASVEEIAQLDRIGPKYAERIVEYRQKNGPFEKPEDILKVRGIGTKTWEVNKDKITVK
jgi:competence protein ComEA